MFPWWGHFLQYFISIPEKVFFINPGSQVWTARRPHHFLQTIFCLLNPNYAPAIWRFCVDLLLETAGLGWWRLDTEQHTNSMSARKHLPAAPLCIWRVVCAVWGSQNPVRGAVEKAVALQSTYSECKTRDCCWQVFFHPTETVKML